MVGTFEVAVDTLPVVAGMLEVGVGISLAAAAAAVGQPSFDYSLVVVEVH